MLRTWTARRGGLTAGLTAVAASATAVALVLLGAVVRVSTAQAAACTGGTVAVVAHPDDDLLFLNPALMADLASGACTTLVYATSGDAGRGSSYSRSREAGVRAAWTKASGARGPWTTATTVLAGHAVTTASLSDRKLNMVFLRLPDGGLDSNGFAATGYSSIPGLLRGRTGSLATADSPSYSYTLASLVQTVAAVISAQGASSVRTQNILDDDDSDHPDHPAVAQIAVKARDLASSRATVTGYRGYGVAGMPANVTGSVLTAKQAALWAYAPYDDQMCGVATGCANRSESAWLARQHVAGTSAPGTTPTATPTATAPSSGPDPGTNAAPSAVVTASSQNASTGQTALKAVDGVVAGFPGTYTNEWATQGGGAGTTLTMTWPSTVSLSSVVLFDRPNTNDRITGGTLTFSDGSTVAVPALDDAGAATAVAFSARSTTWLRLTITSVSATTSNAGLAEIQAWTPAAPGAPTTPTATPTATLTATPTATFTATPTATPTASVNLSLSASAAATSQDTATSQTAAKAVDGVIGGYPGDHTAEWATTGAGAGVALTLTWSKAVSLGRVVLYDRPNTNDRITGAVLTFSDGSTVAVPALDDAGGATTASFAARSTTSLKLTITSVSSTTVNAGLSELQAYSS